MITQQTHSRAPDVELTEELIGAMPALSRAVFLPHDYATSP